MGERIGEQDVVDAQAEVLLETQHAVILHREDFFFRLLSPEAVFHAQRLQAASPRSGSEQRILRLPTPSSVVNNHGLPGRCWKSPTEQSRGWRSISCAGIIGAASQAGL